MRSDPPRTESSTARKLKHARIFAGRLSPARLEPMYATIGTEMPHGDDWTFEPKYDGIRVLAFARPVDDDEIETDEATRSRLRRRTRGVHLMTRNGRDKAAQFPEIVGALRSLAQRVGRPLILDGEIVALERDRPGRFQTLQSRMHLQNVEQLAAQAKAAPAALVTFDILQDGDAELFSEPWAERRRRLERLLRSPRLKNVRLSETTSDGGQMVERAAAVGWEGVIAKRTKSTYRPGARSRDWLKLKLQYRAEFVVGGWTEPRKTRQYIGALLLGYYDQEGRLHYVGHMGGGFTREGLADMYKRLEPLERKTPPFVDPPKTNEPAHWVEPKTVVEVKFAEWTTDQKLRQPIFLGIRDDKDARDVGLERKSLQDWAATMRR
ncbi:MAG: non-homologous end-joining DNA ligase [Gemmatimonadota bacterium]|nr:non-homologous end-joining DNA ligase [Gemmatimonadota bacterium]